MAPSKTDENADLKYTLSVLKACEAMKPDWTQVAAENKIGYARNASARFQNMVKKYGFKFEAGNLTEPGNSATNTTARAPQTPTKAPKAPKADKVTKLSGTKRKAADLEDASSDDSKTDEIPACKDED